MSDDIYRGFWFFYNYCTDIECSFFFYKSKKKKDKPEPVKPPKTHEPVAPPPTIPANFVRGGTPTFQSYTLDRITRLKTLDPANYALLLQYIKYIKSDSSYDGVMKNYKDIVTINFARSRRSFPTELEYTATILHEVFHSIDKRGGKAEEISVRIKARDWLIKQGAAQKSIDKFTRLIEA